jgi:hypothetical protein
MRSVRQLSFFAFRLLFLTAAVSCLTGCLTMPALYVRDKAHQVPPQVAPAVQGTTPHLLLTTKKLREDPENNRDFATVEFKKDGSFADPCVKKSGARPPCQRDYALDFLSRSREAAKTRRLNVIVFIYGNNNWASDASDNYPHFRELLNCLNDGQKAYQDKWRDAYHFTPQTVTYRNREGSYSFTETTTVSKKGVLTCDGIPEPGNNLYVGIFIGWRGATNTTYANISERTAYKISQNDTLSNLLFDMRAVIKTDEPETTGRFLVFGHSFGGLLLERTAIKIYETGLQRHDSIAPCPETPGTEGLPPFADLMVAIGPAVDAVPAKRLIEDFQKFETHQNAAHKGSFCGSAELASSLYRPLMITFLSKEDVWNFGIGSIARHTFGGESGRDKFDNFYEPHSTDVPEPEAQREQVLTKTTATIPYFHTLCDLSSFHLDSKDGEEGNRACNQEKESVFSGNDANGLAKLLPIGLAFPGAAAIKDDLAPLKHIYVRWDCKPVITLPVTNLTLRPVQTDTRMPCLTGEPYNSRSDLHVWNRTPYWITALDIDTYEGHSGFWAPSFVQLISSMADALPALTNKQVLARPNIHAKSATYSKQESAEVP